MDVLGISTGGSVALQLALDHPAAVRRLVLLVGACRLPPAGRELQRRYAELLSPLLVIGGQRDPYDPPNLFRRTAEAPRPAGSCRGRARVTAPPS